MSNLMVGVYLYANSYVLHHLLSWTCVFCLSSNFFGSLIRPIWKSCIHHCKFHPGLFQNSDRDEVSFCSFHRSLHAAMFSGRQGAAVWAENHHDEQVARMPSEQAAGDVLIPPQPLLFVSMLGTMQNSNRKLPTHDGAWALSYLEGKLSSRPTAALHKSSRRCT